MSMHVRSLIKLRLDFSVQYGWNMLINNHEIQDSQRQHQLEPRVALISMNVLLELTIVTVKPCVSIILVHLNVNVLMDMLVMASNVLILTNVLLLKLILGNNL